MASGFALDLIGVDAWTEYLLPCLLAAHQSAVAETVAAVRMKRMEEACQAVGKVEALEEVISGVQAAGGQPRVVEIKSGLRREEAKPLDTQLGKGAKGV